MILRCLSLLATLLPYVLADVQFTAPTAGDTVSAGSAVTIQWQDSGTSPPISALASYQLFLCAGGNAEGSYIQLATLVATGDYTTGNSYSATISPTIGAPGTNAYFLKVISAATGGSVVNFSARFTLSGMTGVFPASVTTGLQSVTGTAGPPTQNEISSPQAGAGAGAAAGGSQYNVPYTMQTDVVRYAPMPPLPKTKITAKNPSRQYPTSAYTPYPTITGTPNAITTNTAQLTFATSSVENTVAAASMPTDTAMARFLERWKD